MHSIKLKIVFILSFLLVMFKNQVSGQIVVNSKFCTCDTTTLRKRFAKYLNKEVYNFLLDDSIRKYRSITPGQEPPGRLCCLHIWLNDSESITIGLEMVKYQPAENDKWNWDVNLIYKEKIKVITFYFPDELNCFVLR